MPFRLKSQAIKLSENDVELACKQLLQYKHFYPLRQQSGLLLAPFDMCPACKQKARWIRIGEPGLPDYAVPRFMVETKAPGGILNPEQEKTIWRLKEHWNVSTAVVESVDELLDWLAHHPEL